MPSVRITRSYTDENGVLRRVGDVIHCTEERAKELIAAGNAAETRGALGPDETKADDGSDGSEDEPEDDEPEEARQ